MFVQLSGKGYEEKLKRRTGTGLVSPFETSLAEILTQPVCRFSFVDNLPLDCVDKTDYENRCDKIATAVAAEAKAGPRIGMVN
jgi:hypothetical protein